MFVTESNFGNNMYLDDVRIANTVGISESSLLLFNMYPTPASEILHIVAGSLQGPIEVAIVDAAGRAVYAARSTVVATNGPLDIPLDRIANGTYTVVVRTNAMSGAKPLVVLNALNK